MGISKKLEEADRGSYVILKSTKLIQKEDIENDPAWDMVAQEYEEAKDSEWLTKATVSIINSIIFQRRVVFLMNRDNLRNLLKNDKNWDAGIGLKAENYSSIIRRICKGLVEKVGEVKINAAGRYVMIFKVVHPDLLKFLQVDVIEQLKEAQNFQKKKTKQEVEDDIKVFQFMAENYKERLGIIKKMEESSLTSENKQAEKERMVLFQEAKIKLMEMENGQNQEMQ